MCQCVRLKAPTPSRLQCAQMVHDRCIKECVLKPLKPPTCRVIALSVQQHRCRQFSVATLEPCAVQCWFYRLIYITETHRPHIRTISTLSSYCKKSLDGLVSGLSLSLPISHPNGGIFFPDYFYPHILKYHVDTCLSSNTVIWLFTISPEMSLNQEGQCYRCLQLLECLATNFPSLGLPDNVSLSCR